MLRSARIPAATMAVAAAVLTAGCGDEGTPSFDTVPPATVADLRVAAVTDSTVTLRWTDTGDDGMRGRADSYDLRYQDAPIIIQEWEFATRITSLPPVGLPGDMQEVTVGDLPVDRTLHFALRILDGAGNASLPSNQVTVRLGAPVCVVDPLELDFGEMWIGGHFDMEFIIRNAGGGTLAGEVSASCPGFSVAAGGGPVSLLAGRSHAVTVRFSPQSAGPAACPVVIGASCGPVLCSGTGVERDPGMLLIDVGGGVTFRMGSPEGEPGRLDDEGPLYVTLTRSFRVSDHEVTQAEWRAVMSWDESVFPGADRPVDSITWFDAVEYCNRLSDSMGLDRAYGISDIARRGNHIESAEVLWDRRSTGFRLLTEAEWEYICRAGSDGAFHTGGITRLDCFPPDQNLDPAGWYCGNAEGSSRPVRGKSANAFDMYDLHGNVYEWCYDYYASDYGAGGQHDPVDPRGPLEGISRVARGGAWISNSQDCRSASRFYQRPGEWFSFVGFRVARYDD